MVTSVTNVAWSAGSFVAQEILNAPKIILFTLSVAGGVLYFDENLDSKYEEAGKKIKTFYESFCKSIRPISPFHDRCGEEDYVAGESPRHFTTREKLFALIKLIGVPIGVVALSTIVIKSYLYLPVKAFDALWSFPQSIRG